MPDRPYIRPLQERVDLLASQGEALRRGWASLYITLALEYGRPVLRIALGPTTLRFTPRGHKARLAFVMVPTTSMLPDSVQPQLPIEEETRLQPHLPLEHPT